MFFLTFSAIVIALITIIYTYYKWSYQYWKRKNFPYLEPSIPFGTSANLFKRREHVGFRMKRHYDNIKSRGWKHAGLYIFTRPNYVVADLDYVKNIMAKDFQYFFDRGTYYNERDDPLSAHLFAISGTKWRNLRAKLTPTFTSGKMKIMFQTLLDCAPNLLEHIEEKCKENIPIDIKKGLACFTIDIIGSCAFGLDCNSFKEENSLFREYGQRVFNTTPSQLFKMIFTMLFPKLSSALRVVVTPKEVTDFFMKVVKDTVDYREKENVTRNDFLQLLIDLKNNGEQGDSITIEEVVAQSFLFFIAGFETSSTTMTFILYELARRPELQEKVRNEINTVLGKYDGKVTYETIQDMKYMDQVINEALRLYPPVPFLTRKCVKDYQIPDEDGIIEKDTTVMIPVLAIHYDEEYYPEPEKFDPERFTEENKSQRHQYAHIPFGEGPRICIGIRFGMMQTKVGLTTLLKNYKFTVSKKTEEPLKMKVNSFVLAAEGEIWLDAEKISGRSQIKDCPRIENIGPITEPCGTPNSTESF